MIFQRLASCILGIILSFPTGAYAGPSLEQMNEIFDTLNYQETDTAANQTAAQTVQSFITDPKNKSALNTPAGKSLIARQTKLLNYLSIEGPLRSCQSNSATDISAEILSAADNAPLAGVRCQERLGQTPNPLDYIRAMQHPLQANVKNSLQRAIYMESMVNAAVSYMDLKIKYSSAPPNSKVVMDLCLKPLQRGGPKNLCDPETKRAMLAATEKYLATQKITRYSPAQGAEAINWRIRKLNEDLSKIPVERRRRLWLFTATSLDPEAKDEYDQRYVSDYIASVSTGPGILMMTDHMKKVAKPLRAENDVTRPEKFDPNYKFKPHKEISPEDVTIAAKEAEDTVRSQCWELGQMDNDRAASRGQGSSEDRARTADLKELVRVNPAAVGRVLINHPEMAGLVCSIITQTTADDIKHARLKKYYLFGGLVVGGALMVTGIGAAVGAPLLGITTIGGVGVGTIGTVTSGLSLAAGAADAGFYTNEAINAKKAANDFDASFLSGTDNQRNVLETYAALSDYKRAVVAAVTSAVLSAADIVALSQALKAARLAKQGAQAGSDLLKSATDLLKEISENPKYATGLAHLKSSLAKNEMGEFLGYLAALPMAQRLKILENLQKLSPDDLQKALTLARQKGVSPEVAMAELSKDTPNAKPRTVQEVEVNFQPLEKGNVGKALKSQIADAASHNDFDGFKLFGKTWIQPKAGKDVNYFVDKDGVMYVTETPIDFKSMAPGSKIKGPDGKIIEPVEAGKFHFDAKSKVVFEPELKGETAPSAANVPEAAPPPREAGLAEAGGGETPPPTPFVQKGNVVKCSSLAAGATSPLAFLGLPILVDEVMQGGLMTYHHKWSNSLDATNSGGRLGYIVLMDLQMKQIDEYIMDRTSGFVAPMAIKFAVNIGDEKVNEVYNKLLIDLALKAGVKISKEDLERAHTLSMATSKGNYEANIGQKVIAGTLVDYYLKKQFASHMMAFCLANPKYAFVVNSLNVRVVERSIGSLGAGAWVDHRTSEATEKPKDK